MKVEAVSICVNYADYLRISLPINKKIVDKIIIVTRLDDIETQKVCIENYVEFIATNEFNNHPSGFNKFKGINKGLEKLDKDGWVLFLDSDIVLDPLTRRVFDNLKLDENALYGCDRVNCIGYDNWLTRKELILGNWLLTPGSMELGARICQYYGQQGDNGRFAGWKPLGFFQLVHNSTLLDYPTDTDGYDRCDMLFANRYARENRIFIPEILAIHLESQNAQMGDNWKGRVTLPFQHTGKIPFKTRFKMYYRRFEKLFYTILIKLYNR